MNIASILVVDDDDAVRMALTDVVELKSQYRTDQAATGQEALDKLGKKSFDVVLLDLTLPDIDGMDLLCRLKESRYLAEVIILTGLTSLEKAEEAVAKGAFAYLVKPSSPQILMATIEKALQKRGTLS